MRENTAAGLTLPTRTDDGRELWIDPGVQEIVDLMHYGDPTLGWEGDERLGLYMDRDGRWAIYRLEHDNVLRRFCQAPTPETPLDRGLIVSLVAHDARKGFDPVVFADEQKAAEDRRALLDLG